MIAVDIKMVKAVQQHFAAQIKAQYDLALQKLQLINTNDIADLDYKFYLADLISLFINNDQILVAEPEELKKIMDGFRSLPLVTEKKDGRAAVDARKAFVNKIHTALDYKGLREKFYPEYFSKLGIKVCVYCNAQLAITIRETKNGYSARFDVDHHISRNLYPGFGISLFNLYPACAPCNRKKSQQPVDFKLYSHLSLEFERSGFVFKLDPYAKAKYLLSPDREHIDVHFVNRIDPNDLAHEQFFNISSIYRTQKDVAEELIMKSQIYDATYKKILAKTFDKLRINHADIGRILTGNYTKEPEIHSRPLSKYIQDLSKELGIIDRD